MKFYFTLFILLFQGYYSICQEYCHDFGKISLEDYNLKVYSQDPNAEAVIIYDKGLSYFQINENNFDVIFKKQTKLRILKSEGKKYANFEIPYYSSETLTEKVTDIEAFTYNMIDGRIIRSPLKIESIKEENISDNWKVKKIVMPNVKDSSIIEYRYKICSPHKFGLIDWKFRTNICNFNEENKYIKNSTFKYNLRDWAFQSRIPTIYSEYIVKMNPFYEYVFMLQGIDKFDVHESYRDTGIKKTYRKIEYDEYIHKYVMNDIPAFKDENFISSINDYIIKIEFQLSKVNHPNGNVVDIISSWKELNNQLLKDIFFGKYINNCIKYAKKLPQIKNIRKLEPKDRLNKIINNIKNEYVWNGNKNKYATKKLSSFVKEKSGNSANINLLLIGYLKAAGLDVQPIIISTRDHGKVKTGYPFLQFFNYVIGMVKINDKKILIDATNKLCPNHLLPPTCINDMGLIVKKDQENWIKIYQEAVSIIQKEFLINFSKNLQNIECQICIRNKSHDALILREKYKDNIESLKIYSERNGCDSLESLSTQNFNEINKPYNINYKTTIPVVNKDGKILISPFLGEVINVNPFKYEKRKYSVDLIYPRRRIFATELNIPKNYKINHLPDDYKFKNKLVIINYSIKKTGKNHIEIIADYTFRKSIYKPEEYKIIRYLTKDIINKFNEKIIISRI